MSSLPGTRGRRRIYLMRHGEVSYHRPDGQVVFGDVELTEEGVAQARQMRTLLADVHFDAAACTCFRRTRQTAELVLSCRGLPIHEVAGLQEIQAGDMAGLTEARIEAEFVYGMERAAEPGAGFPGGETFADFQGRVIPAFESLVLEQRWTTMLLVAHAATNAVILSWFTRGGLAGLSAFEQDAGCVNVLDVDVIDGEIVRRLIRAINLTPYNYAKRDHFLTVAERIILGRIGRERRSGQGG